MIIDMSLDDLRIAAVGLGVALFVANVALFVLGWRLYGRITWLNAQITQHMEQGYA